MFYGDLPPVGHRLVLPSGGATEANWQADLYGPHYWVDSGTSALALALLDAKARQPTLKQPQAIIPGYCCPDLVAACVYAGVQPVAVDIGEQDPAYDLEQLRAALNGQVVAVIAINFLGIAERLVELRELLDATSSHTLLIEDNAQWFPLAAGQLSGLADFVTFSFGRGKPMSLLGGGLLLGRQPLQDSVAAHLKPAVANSALLLTLKAHAYNLLLNPRAYFFLNRNPLLSLGQTIYHPLDQINSLTAWQHALFSVNYEAYKKRHGPQGKLQQLRALYRQQSAGLQQWQWEGSVRDSGLLLRYPLLCATEQAKAQLLARLVADGLGASPFYPAEITAINGIDGRVAAPYGLANARSFARRFLTLPLHESVSEPYRQRIVTCLGES